MSSFSENSVAAGTEIRDSQAQKQFGYGTGGADDNGATSPHAPPNLSETVPATTAYQPEGALLTNPENSNVVMSDQMIGNGADAVYAPLSGANVSAPALEVTNETASEAAVQVAAAAELSQPEAVHSSVVNNVLPTSQTNPNPNPPVTNDQNNGNDSQFLTPGVVGVSPSAVSNQNNDGSNEVVTPSVVNYENNGIGNSSVAINGGGVGEAIKRKRGRPRKYPISEAASTVPVSAQGAALVNAQVQGSFEKRGRGRPAGSSGKKHKADAPSPFTVSPTISGSSIGAAFMPYLITVRSGEYVQPKLLSLSQVDKQVVCVLSASGNLSTVTLQQPSSSGGTVTYQGCFEILSLSGSFLLSESGGRRSTTGGLSVSLALPNGCILGGGVAGPLIADSDVQIIVGTFLASEHLTIPHCNEVLTAPLNHISSVGESPPSRALLSESSGAGGNPFNCSNGVLNNGNQQPVPKVAWM